MQIELWCLVRPVRWALFRTKKFFKENIMFSRWMFRVLNTTWHDTVVPCSKERVNWEPLLAIFVPFFRQVIKPPPNERPAVELKTKMQRSYPQTLRNNFHKSGSLPHSISQTLRLAMSWRPSMENQSTPTTPTGKSTKETSSCFHRWSNIATRI